MSRQGITVTFAMTGVLTRNGRALRQIRLLQQLVDRVEVIAGTRDGAGLPEMFEDNVRLHTYELPTAGGPGFFWKVHKAVKKATARLQSDVHHASDLYVLPAMESSSRRSGGRLVYDARELYPFVQGTVGKPWAKFFWSQLEERFATRADLVLTVNDSIADKLGETYGISRPVVLHNVPDHGAVRRSEYLRTHLPVTGPDVLVLHLGYLRDGRGCSSLIRAMGRVRGANLVFVGDGPARRRLKDLADSEGLADRVFFLDPVPYRDVLDVTAGADVGVSLLEDTCLNHRYALPNKLFEYLAAGLPVVVSDFPEMGRIVKEFEVGLTVDPADVQSVAAAIQRMVDDPSSRSNWGRNTIKVGEAFNWENASTRMKEAYEQLLRPDSTA